MKHLLLALAAASILAFPVAADSKDDEIAKLKNEVALLRAETQELRKMLALSIPPPARTNTPGAAATTAARAAGQTHWLTESSLIRHNNSCQYYQKSIGRACAPNEGTACRFCGG